MQNGDFPGKGAKSLDYRLILDYKKGYENHNGAAWAFSVFHGKRCGFPGIFSRSHIPTTTPFPAPR
jgi:hypothetical protein